MGAKKTKKSETPEFEAAMSGLEETVRRLEAGDLPLEDSLREFEKGIALVRTLHARLDAVQMRIDELTQAGDGSVTRTPLAAARIDAGEDDGDHDGDDE